MAIISQKSLFGWENYEKFDGLKRLEMILAVLDDEELMSALERVNSRLDNMFGFENHTIRGIKKMSFRVTLAYVLMLAFAVAMVRAGKGDKIRSFLSAA
jgi:hypothetical protein